MKLINISRGTAEKLPWTVDNRDWLISIHSVGSKEANISAPFGMIFRFCFNDVEKEELNPITQQDAEAIASIIKEAEKSQIKTLWVHCDAGICRSGAIVEAAALLGHTPDDEISNERFANGLVFNLVRKALGIFHSGEKQD